MSKAVYIVQITAPEGKDTMDILIEYFGRQIDPNKWPGYAVWIKTLAASEELYFEGKK